MDAMEIAAELGRIDRARQIVKGSLLTQAMKDRLLAQLAEKEKALSSDSLPAEAASPAVSRPK